jgi:hypothetical protein
MNLAAEGILGLHGTSHGSADGTLSSGCPQRWDNRRYFRPLALPVYLLTGEELLLFKYLLSNHSVPCRRLGGGAKKSPRQFLPAQSCSMLEQGS